LHLGENIESIVQSYDPGLRNDMPATDSCVTENS
jgi:hypothetical protein